RKNMNTKINCLEGTRVNHNENMLKGNVNAGLTTKQNGRALKGNVHAGIELNHNENTLGTACVGGRGVNQNESISMGHVHAGVTTNPNQRELGTACTGEGLNQKESTLTSVLTFILLTGLNHNESMLKGKVNASRSSQHNESVL